MNVTFDANTIRRTVLPDVFSKDPHHAAFVKIHRALASGRLRGFISETIITLEGIRREDRAAVFAGTRLRSTVREELAENGQRVIAIKTLVEQPDRQPLRPKAAEPVVAALALGVRLLGAPRVGGIRVEDSDGRVYATDTNLADRLEKYHGALRAIEGRGLGRQQLRALGEEFARRYNLGTDWLRGLEHASDVHEENRVIRAVAEWSDADSVAAHIGYGIDTFCSEDYGRGAGGPSVLDPANRAWLTQTFGVRFTTLIELADMLDAPG